MTQSTKIYGWASLLSFAILLLCLIYPAFPDHPAVDIVFYALLLSIGLIHGANDLSLYRSKKQKTSAIKFIAFYVAIALLVGMIVYLDPVIGINIFLLLSAFHFGEEHFSWWVSSKTKAYFIWCFVYGLSIFSLLFLTHLQSLEEFLIENGYQVIVLSWSYFLLIPILVAQTILALGHLSLEKISWRRFLFLEGTLVLLYFVFKQLDLFQAFVFYFVFWHSIPSIASQLKELNWKGYPGIKKYIGKALPFYIISLMGLGLLYYWLGTDLFALSTIVLIGAMTTIPHVVLFVYLRKDRMEHKKEIN